MPKFLFVGSYTQQGLAGLIKEGGTGRAAAVRALVDSAGGTLEGFYFAHGRDDFYVIVDLPDAITAMAVSATINLSGAVHARTVVLATPEEVDAARKITVKYRPPGQ